MLLAVAGVTAAAALAGCGTISAEEPNARASTPPAASGAPDGWDNPQQRGTMRLLNADTAMFRDQAGHAVRFTRQAAPRRPLCR